MMKRKRGYVLLTVLLFIQIYALLTLSVLEQIILEQHLLSEQKNRRHLLEAAERRLSQLLQGYSEETSFCALSPLAPEQLSQQPLAWWLSSACTEKNGSWRYYYIVENLGMDPCAQIRGHPQGQAAYYRLSLLTDREEDENQKVLLQATLITESSHSEHCDHLRHWVDLGPQSWHELL